MITNLGILGVARKVYLIVSINISKMLLEFFYVIYFCIHVDLTTHTDLLQVDVRWLSFRVEIHT